MFILIFSNSMLIIINDFILHCFRILKSMKNFIHIKFIEVVFLLWNWILWNWKRYKVFPSLYRVYIASYLGLLRQTQDRIAFHSSRTQKISVALTQRIFKRVIASYFLIFWKISTLIVNTLNILTIQGLETHMGIKTSRSTRQKNVKDK